MPTLTGAEKIDDHTVALTTSEPDALLPYNITNLFIVSPTAWQKQYDAVPASRRCAARSKQAWTRSPPTRWAAVRSKWKNWFRASS
jgi:peptide/nickel transport system substrate-binding protein